MMGRSTRKKTWRSCGGRTLLVFGILASQFIVTTTSSKAEGVDPVSNVMIISENEQNVKFVKNEINSKLFDDRNEENLKRNLNDIDSALKTDKEHLKLFRRQGTNQSFQHRHSDGITYYFKGYKCVPVRKPSRKFEALRGYTRTVGTSQS